MSSLSKASVLLTLLSGLFFGQCRLAGAEKELTAMKSCSELSIALLADLSGNNAQNGEACRRGYETARALVAPDDRLATKHIRFIFGDHRGQSTTAVSEYRRMVNTEGAIAVISNRGTVGMALNALSKTDKIPFLGVMGQKGLTEDNPYSLRFWLSPRREGQALARVAQALGKKHAAILVVEDDITLSVREEFEQEFRKLGGQIVFSESFSQDTVDFSPLVTKMKRAKADVIFADTLVGQLGGLIKRLREQGLKQQIISNVWLSFPEVIKQAGAENIQGSRYVSVDSAKPIFQNYARKHWGELETTDVMYGCYAALATLLEVLKAQPNICDQFSLASALQSLKQVPLPDGPLKFENREAQFDLLVKETKARP